MTRKLKLKGVALAVYTQAHTYLLFKVVYIGSEWIKIWGQMEIKIFGQPVEDKKLYGGACSNQYLILTVLMRLAELSKFLNKLF